MLDAAFPDAQGQEVDPLALPAAPEGRQRRCDALKLSADFATLRRSLTSR